MDFSNLVPLDVSKIKKLEFSETQYYKEEQTKKQIVLHHTVSGSNIDNIVSNWASDSARVATCVIIGRDGTCNQLFSSKYWAHHIGLKSESIKLMGFDDYGSRNLELNKHSIGIELINWGGLTRVNDAIYTVYKNKIKTDISEYPDTYQGFTLFESYSIPQLNTLGALLLYLNKKYSIPLEYHAEMFQPSLNAVRGAPGIWSHTSYRSDKSDVHPDPNLIKMLMSLSLNKV